MGDPPFYSPRGVSITRYLKVEESCVREREFLALPIGVVTSVSRGCQACQSELSGDHRPSLLSWSGRLVLFLCAEPSPSQEEGACR
jgi:hypothetical protein